MRPSYLDNQARLGDRRYIISRPIRSVLPTALLVARMPEHFAIACRPSLLPSPGKVEVILVQRARDLDRLAPASHNTLRQHQRPLVWAHVLCRIPFLSRPAEKRRG